MKGNFEKEYEIKYYDCKDKDITFSQLIKYTQETSTLHSALAGCNMEYLNKNKIGWILLENHCKMHKYPKMGEKITIKTWVNDIQKIYAFRNYEIVDEHNNLVLQSYTKWVLYSFEKKRPIKVTDEVKNMYTYVDEKSIYIDNINFDIDSTFDKIVQDVVLYKDVDTNWHMNNVSYIKAVSEAMGQDFLDNYEVQDCLLKYNHQLIYNTQFNICVNKINDLEYIYNVKENKIENETKRKNSNNTDVYIKWRKKSESNN